MSAAFGDLGDRVVGLDRSSDGGPPGLELRAADVTDPQSVGHAVASIVEDYGRIDVLVNNAAVFHEHDTLSLPFSEYRAVMAVNLDGVVYMSLTVAQQMAGQGSGVIVNIASGAAFRARRNRLPYSVSKAGVVQVTRGLALDLAQYGIRVNCVAPGFMETQMMSNILGDPVAEERARGLVALGRFADPSEIAPTVVYLASPDAGYITGQTIGVNGGTDLA